MLKTTEFNKDILTHLLTPAGPLPTIQDPDGVYPYQSYVETSNRPVIKTYQFVSLENNHMKVEICPDLGGKVYSIIHKKSGKEVLYVPQVIKHTRILPRFYFVAGGIEVSFPISHTPSQNEKVHYQLDNAKDRIYVSVGETELRFGMQWTVEFSLGANDEFLTQRCLFVNPTNKPHEWMSWSNAAVPANGDTQLYFPKGNVLLHEDELKTIQWENDGPNTNADIKKMSGYFWKKPECNAFGIFNPSEGIGLYHIADPRKAPGMKLWSYGSDRDEKWSLLSCMEKQSYLEIQGGPIADQSIKHTLQPGSTNMHTEYWIPTDKPFDINSIKLPNQILRPKNYIPRFGWPEEQGVDVWQKLIDACSKKDACFILDPSTINNYNWPPSGMAKLGDAFEWALKCDPNNNDQWLYYWGIWLGGTGKLWDSIYKLEESNIDPANALLGRLYYQHGMPDKSKAAFDKILNPSLSLHPQIVVERDKTLEALGGDMVPVRKAWLDKVNASEDEWIIERRIGLLIDLGEFDQAKLLLENTEFQKIHQRYVRKGLWKKLNEKSGMQLNGMPKNLAEDDLAFFGAYRAFENKQIKKHEIYT